jgi:hypothetical protein
MCCFVLGTKSVIYFTEKITEVLAGRAIVWETIEPACGWNKSLCKLRVYEE